MMKTYDIFDSITGYLLQEINIRWCRASRQHFMLALPVFNDIPIFTYQRGTLPTFMLAYGTIT